MFYSDFPPQMFPKLISGDIETFAARLDYLLKGMGKARTTLGAAFHASVYSPRLQKDAEILGLALGVSHQKNEPFYPAVQKFVEKAENIGVPQGSVDRLKQLVPALRAINERSQKSNAGAWKTLSIARVVVRELLHP